MAKQKTNFDPASDILPDAWERFESAVDTVSKCGPIHRRLAVRAQDRSLFLGSDPKLMEAINFIYSGGGSAFGSDTAVLREKHREVLLDAIRRAELLQAQEAADQVHSDPQSRKDDHSPKQYCIVQLEV
jgi:hypothetical protein